MKGTSFNTFQLILCRNVLIYFNVEHQKKVLELLIDSLDPLGYLVLGMMETIKDPELLERLKPVNERLKIYRKIH